jgi:hypothetical protein
MQHAEKASTKEKPQPSVVKDAEKVLQDQGDLRKAWQDLAEMDEKERASVLAYLQKKDANLEKYIVSAQILDSPGKGMVSYTTVLRDAEKEKHHLNFEVNIGAKQAHDDLEKRAHGLIGDGQQFTQLRKEVADFEEAARKRHLSDSEIANSFYQLNRLMSDSPNTKIPMDRRIQMVHEALTHAVKFSDINQGVHETCLENSLECRTYALHPSGAMRVLADAALTGKVTCRDGSQIQLSDATLLPQPNQSDFLVGRRSLTSQILQTAAVNIYWQRQTRTQDGHEVPPGSLRFEPDPNSSEMNNERLMDYSKHPPRPVIDPETGKPQKSPRLLDLADVSNQITGLTEKESDISLGGYYRSEDELRHALEDRLKVPEGKGFPVEIGIDASKKAFAEGLSFLPQWLLNLSKSPHSIVITGYNPATGRLTVAMHDKGYDHLEVSLSELFHALN